MIARPMIGEPLIAADPVLMAAVLDLTAAGRLAVPIRVQGQGLVPGMPSAVAAAGLTPIAPAPSAPAPIVLSRIAKAIPRRTEAIIEVAARPIAPPDVLTASRRPKGGSKPNCRP